jgi:hypothetical protein
VILQANGFMRLSTMGAAEKETARFNTLFDNPAFAVYTPGRYIIKGTLDTIEGLNLACQP